jgi:hypothetical protein
MKKIPKTLQKFADEHNLGITVLKFKHAASGQWVKRPGYSIHSKEIVAFDGKKFHRVYFELEPIDHPCGYKWLVKNHMTIHRYLYRLCKYALESIPLKLNQQFLIEVI